MTSASGAFFRSTNVTFQLHTALPRVTLKKVAAVVPSFQFTVVHGEEFGSPSLSWRNSAA